MAKVKKEIERIVSPSSSLSPSPKVLYRTPSTGFSALNEPILPTDGLSPHAAPVSLPEHPDRGRTPFSENIIDAIAKEIGKIVASHIEIMYPEAAKAVAWKSAALSIEGVVRNSVKAAGEAAESGRIEEWLRHSKNLRLIRSRYGR